MRDLSRLAAGLLLAGLSSCALNVPYDKYAIVYGVANYQAPVSPLNYTDDDAIAMAALLTGQGYQVILQLDSDATKNQLENTDIPAIAGQTQEQDLFVFYFSGHGGQASAGAENPGSDASNEYIYLYGSDSGPNIGLTFSDDQLAAALAPIAARKKVHLTPKPGASSATSCRPTGPALEDSGISSRLPSHHLTQFRRQLGTSRPGRRSPSAAGERELSYESPNDFGIGPRTITALHLHRRPIEGDRIATVG
jgi:hypothetical protein